MASTAKATTVYLRPELHKALRLKSLETSCSMSELVNDAVLEAMKEDEEDLRVIDARKRDPRVSYADFIKELKQDGKI